VKAGQATTGPKREASGGEPRIAQRTDVEFATLDWVARFNNKRLLAPLG
jgi:hypothetical protein